MGLWSVEEVGECAEGKCVVMCRSFVKGRDTACQTSKLHQCCASVGFFFGRCVDVGDGAHPLPVSSAVLASVFSHVDPTQRGGALSDAHV